jgi:hypothetical protein
MQDAAQTGSSRREARIPFEVVVELCAGAGAERLEADGLNLSMGGMAMSAPFTPPLGALLECRFQCPPTGDLVCAQGEVTWVAESGPELGNFGLRFVELDTKSATTLRRYLANGEPREAGSDRLRSATLLIDGLGAPVDADLKLADETRIVLEQQLAFLQLGRGVEVQVLGRGKERGRIASVELRHTDFDVPTLVFGILLDGAPERAIDSLAGSAGPLSSETLEVTDLDEVEASGPRAAGAVAAAAYVAEPTGATARRSQLDLDLPVAAVSTAPPRNSRTGAAAQSSSTRALSGESERATPLAQRLSSDPLARASGALRAAWAAVLAGWRGISARVGPALREQAEALELPDKKTRVLLHVARLRANWLGLWRKRAGARRSAGPSSRPPLLRVQRTTLPGVGPDSTGPSTSRRTRLLAAAVVLLGAGLSAYALAPRSGADRLRLPERVERAPTASVAAAKADDGSGGSGGEAAPAAAAEERAQPAAPRTTEPWGDAEVPNGQLFALRMRTPVISFEGESLDDGFKVRVPRGFSRDQARPIAAAHPAIKRAMIMNRSAYAELIIEFVPGLRPRYQVVGKGNKLELTIERL